MDASSWDDRYAQTPMVWSAEPNMFVVEEITRLLGSADNPSHPGRALDLAGGEGRNALWLAEQGFDTELVEFSSVALDKAANAASTRGVELTLSLHDVTTFPALEPADLVLLCYLQLPISQVVEVYAYAARLVKPGGTLLVIAHEKDNLTRGYGGPPDENLLPCVADVVAAVSGTLTVERAEQVTRVVPTEDGDKHAIDLVVRAVRAPQTDG
jgi:ubiquinone/menaquinone biosynthesis C-methylase UbiE